MRIRSPLAKTAASVVAAALASLLVTLTVTPEIPFWHPMPVPFMETVLQVKMFVSTFSAILMLVLLWNYVAVYRRMSNRFTLSLVIFTVALLLYALASNPLIHLSFGFRGAGLGPFAFIPDLFATAAVIVLLHRSFS